VANSAEAPQGDAFGQAGIRQYFGRVWMWICITGMVCCSGMWHRSLRVVDMMEWRGTHERMAISSIASRMKISVATFPGAQSGETGWTYYVRPYKITADNWQDGFWKTVGIEFSLSPEAANANGGFWIRVKWYFAASVFAAMLVTQFLLKWRRSREAAA